MQLLLLLTLQILQLFSIQSLTNSNAFFCLHFFLTSTKFGLALSHHTYWKPSPILPEADPKHGFLNYKCGETEYNGPNRPFVFRIPFTAEYLVMENKMNSWFSAGGLWIQRLVNWSYGNVPKHAGTLNLSKEELMYFIFWFPFSSVLSSF